MLSKRMESLKPYVPGEQPTDRVYIKLNANENPYPPPPSVIRTVSETLSDNPMKMALYPDPDSTALKTEIAAMLNATGGVLCRSKDGKPDKKDSIPFKITPDMIFSGNGSDEVLSFVFYAFFDSDAPLITPEYSYSFYPVYAGYYNIPMKRIPLKKDWTLDTDAMLSAPACTGMIFANPNAPTSIAISRDKIREMLQSFPSDKVFVVDEAYVDFGGESVIPLLAEFPNLLVVRTFSKSLSFAGMRTGYIVASPTLIKAVTTVKNSFNHFPIDGVAQIAAKAACKEYAYYADCARKIAQERDSFSEFLKSHGWYVLPSSTNFLFVKKEGLSGSFIYESIKKEGILVRYFNTPGITDFVRITIGTTSQMDSLKKVMSRF